MAHQRTNIEQLMNLDEIFQGSPMQSVDGRPPMPGVNSNFNQQMMAENSERDKYATPMSNKMRTNVNMSRAMDGGSRSIPTNHYRELEYQPEDPNNYRMGPNAYPTQTRNYVPQNYHSLEGYKHREISCIEIANHVRSCPICSKFYDNDKSVYVIIIVILAIVCVILFKKVLENMTNK
jgi:hypothetical protein